MKILINCSPSCRSKPVRPLFICRTQMKILLMKSESSLTLHRPLHNWNVPRSINVAMASVFSEATRILFFLHQVNKNNNFIQQFFSSSHLQWLTAIVESITPHALALLFDFILNIVTILAFLIEKNYFLRNVLQTLGLAKVPKHLWSCSTWSLYCKDMEERKYSSFFCFFESPDATKRLPLNMSSIAQYFTMSGPCPMLQ